MGGKKDELAWKKLNRKILLEHPRLTVAEDEVELPNGHTTDYLHFPGETDATTVILRRKDGAILVQQEFSYPPQKTLYQFPGGKVEPNETDLRSSALRELREESGFTAKRMTPLGSYYVNNRRSAQQQHAFLGEQPESDPLKSDAEETILSYWFSENKIDQMIRSGHIQNRSLLAAWCLYKVH